MNGERGEEGTSTFYCSILPVRLTNAGRRIMELSTAIKNTFDPVIQKHLYPRSELDIYVQVLQQDGGERHIYMLPFSTNGTAGVLQTCINATTMALITAGIPLIDFVCGLTVGVHTTDVLLDLTNLEETDVPHLTIATMPRSGKVTLVSMETRMNVERFGEMLELGGQAGKVLGEEMRDVVRAWGEDRMKTQKMIG
jgi:exosome complex component RRP41